MLKQCFSTPRDRVTILVFQCTILMILHGCAVKYTYCGMENTHHNTVPIAERWPIYHLWRVCSQIQAEKSTKSSDDRTLQQEVQATTQEVTGLIKFDESANLEKEQIPGKEVLSRISNPFPDQTPTQVLRRSYLIAQINWTPSFVGYLLAFPQSLFAVEAISNFLSVYEYIRAGVRITVRVNSTPYHQGALLTAILPCRQGATVTDYQYANMRPVVLSASVQDSTTIDVPYMNPLSWLDIATCADYAICTFALRPFNNLITTSTGVPASCTVSIFASFLDPKVAGFVEPSSIRNRMKDRMKAQSVTERRATFTNSKAEVVPVPESDTKKEGEDKSKNGTTVQGIQKVVGGASEILKMIPVLGPIWTPIAKFISTFGKVLDEPFNPAVPQGIDQNLNFNDLAHCQGLFSGQQLTLYPGVQTSKENFGMESSYMMIHELAQVPALHYQTSFTTQDQVVSIGLTPLTPNNVAGVDFLGFVAAEFTLWRGSIKYFFHFVNSAFYSARFRISYATTAPGSGDGDLPQMIVDVKGDTMTEFCVPYLYPTPWRPTGDSFVAGNPKLTVEMITPISGSTSPSTPLIYLNVWRSGGEDIQFNLLRNSYYVYNPSQLEKLKKKKETKVTEPIPIREKVRAQTTIATRFQKTFPPIMAGSQFSAEFRTCAAELPIRISDMMKRWSDVPNNFGSYPLADTIFPQSISTDLPYYDYTSFQYWSNVFLFWRGSRRWRFFANLSDVAYLQYGTTFAPSVSQGQAVVMTNCASDLLRHNDIEVPWISEVPYSYVVQNPPVPFTAQFGSPGNLDYEQGTLQPDTVYLKAGDDFQFLYLWPPVIQPE